MRADIAGLGRLKGLVLTGAAALSVVAAGAFAQTPPPGAPPQSAPEGGPPSQFGPPPPPPLTEAQKLAASLPPPMPGGMPPLPPEPPGAPKPASDPRDLQGAWVHDQNLEFRMQNDMYGRPIPYTMEGAEVLARRVRSLNAGKPFINASSKCRPPGVEWQRDLNMPFQIFQSKDWIEFIFEEYHGRWRVLMNPDSAPAPAARDYIGRSVGHWDGSTLVVETTDMKQGVYLDTDGTPLSHDGKITSRIRKVDNGDGHPFLEIVSTFEDPRYYTHPWSVVRTFGWTPSLAVFHEYNCEEQIGDPSTPPDPGLIPEPQD